MVSRVLQRLQHLLATISISFRVTASTADTCSTATAGTLQLKVEALTDFHLALPENESFLKADLSKNTAEELAYAEQAH